MGRIFFWFLTRGGGRFLEKGLCGLWRRDESMSSCSDVHSFSSSSSSLLVLGMGMGMGEDLDMEMAVDIDENGSSEEQEAEEEASGRQDGWLT